MKTSPVSPRLDGLVKGWVQRSYLKGLSGFWADEILREFTFLEERGTRLMNIAFHQKGSVMTYEGPDLVVMIEYGADDEPPSLRADIGIRGHRDHRLRSVDDWLLEVDPATVYPTRPVRDRDAMSANIRFWAEGIRRWLDRPQGQAG